jgi:tRNA dimethylallyltransferase
LSGSRPASHLKEKMPTKALRLPRANSESWPLLVIVGPTGAGKTSLALHLGEQLRGEIVNCDSVQIYRHFNIGSAKLPPAERRAIPHHLIDICEPEEIFTAGDYSRRAREVLNAIRRRQSVPVIVGGTGFYLRALLEGLFEGPQRNDELRSQLLLRESRRPGFLHRLLRRLDPETGKRIHSHDVQKLIRAVEVCLLTGKPMSALANHNRRPLQGFRVLKIGLNPSRPALYATIRARTMQMFTSGLVEETRQILALGYPPTCKPFESLGYAQALKVIQGVWSLDQAIEDTCLQTRRYAKRQWTWFRSDKEIHWIEGFGDDPVVKEAAWRIACNFFDSPPPI